MQSSENNIFATFLYKYFPYWPLFVLLLVVSLLCTRVYLTYFAVPSFETTASLIIKDEKKGVNDSKMTESIDAFTTSKIVENEINVLHSRTLMKEVVNKLKLYAPIYEDGKFISTSAYLTSPIVIELKAPKEAKEVEKIYFSYDDRSKLIKLHSKFYPINKWVFTPYGEMKFSKNSNRKESAKSPLYFSILSPKIAVNQLLDRITIQPSSKVSTVIELTLQDDVPNRGEDILNYLIKTYNNVEVKQRVGLASNTLKFVEDRIKLVEKELDELENKLVQYKSTKGGVDLSEQGKQFLESVGSNDRKIAEVNNQLAILGKVERYVVSKNKTAGIVPSTLGINDPVLSQLLEKLYNTEIEYQKLKKTTAENNPILVTLADEVENIRPSILENINSQRVNLEAIRTNLITTSQRYTTALQSIPQKERELLELSRQQAIKNNAYSFLLQKREETVLSYAPTVGDSRIIDKAESSVVPVNPNPLHLYLAAVMAAFALGVLLIKGKEILNSKLLFRSEIEESTHAPIVAELTFGKHKKEKLFNVPSDVSIIEQFRQLRATMGLYGRTFTKKKILVTSSIPGEGKSFVSSNLAYSLASSGKRVILIDFDLRNPSSSQLFNLYKQKGITEYLVEDIKPSEIIFETSFNNLNFISAGINVGDNTELLLNGKLEILFAYLEEVFDYIIIDTPPVDLVSDAYLLSEYCDITLLVMRHAYTPKSLVQRLGQDHKLRSLNNVGIVFNGIKPRGFIKGQYGYGYGYGHDFKYADKTYRNRSINSGA